MKNHIVRNCNQLSGEITKQKNDEFKFGEWLNIAGEKRLILQKVELEEGMDWSP